MRARRLFVVPFAVVAVAIGATQGCQDATQATLEIRMLKSELCANSGGSAIAVGTDRDDTEQRITTYVTAETRDCDATTGEIGSLVVTPGESGKAAIVVAVAFDKNRARTASECKPPAYAGCIVARRFLTFTSHKNVRLPITIDPDCLDVPCNAVSTCRKGNCYDSTTVNGEEPGDDGKGGALEGGIVDGSVDGFTPDGSKSDGATESGADGSADGGSEGGSDGGGDAPLGPFPTCMGTTLYCDNPSGTPRQCSAPNPTCCTLGGGGTGCTPACTLPQQRCCSNPDCAPNGCCNVDADAGGVPGFCVVSDSGPINLVPGANCAAAEL